MKTSIGIGGYARADISGTVDFVRQAEALGVDYVWSAEAWGQDAVTSLAYLAGQTSRIKLGTGILILPQHNPVITAKQVATLDHLSSGRIMLGIGVGWMKEEFDALGAEFDERGPRTDEYMQAMRALWTEDKPSFAGEYVRFENAYCRPQPHQPAVPIVVGGHSKAAARRAGRLGDGFFPARGVPMDLIDLARATAAEHGRDPAQIEITVSVPDDLEELDRLANLGVSRVLVPVASIQGMNTVISGPEDALAWKDRLARYADL